MNWKRLAVLASLAVSASAWAQNRALQGIETSDLDRSVQPCDNFFDYSNGTWRKENPIPASMDRWSRRWKSGEDNKDQLRKILDDVTAGPAGSKGSTAQLTGDFYAACTNVKAVNEAGITPLKPYLAAIDAIQDRAGLQKEITELQAIGVQVPFSLNSHAASA